MRFDFQLGEVWHRVELEKSVQGYRARVDGQPFDIEVQSSEEGRFSFRIERRSHTAYVTADNARTWAHVDGKVFVLTKAEARIAKRGASHAHAGEEVISSPMPGQVRAVNVAEGDAVEKGQTL